MNSNICSHPTKVTTQSRVNCGLCNVFISSLDNKAAIKDPTLEGLHQIYPSIIYTNLLADSCILSLKLPIPSSYLRLRRMLIDWLKIIKDRFRLSNSTFHIAIRYMDFILSQKEYHESKFQLIALSSLIIAAKYDELDINIPFPEDFTRIAKLPFHNYVIAQCEMLLLEILKWKLKIATSYNIAYCLLSQGILFDTDKMIKNNMQPKEEHAMLLTRMVGSLLDDSIRSILLYKTRRICIYGSREVSCRNHSLWKKSNRIVQYLEFEDRRNNFLYLG